MALAKTYQRVVAYAWVEATLVACAQPQTRPGECVHETYD